MWLKRKGVHNPQGLLIGWPAASLKGTQKSSIVTYLCSDEALNGTMDWVQVFEQDKTSCLPTGIPHFETFQGL